MCLMAVTSRRAMIPAANLQNAFDHNSDGFGVMYAEGGRVVAWKHKGPYAEFAAHWATVPENKIIAVHFRFGTSGPSNAEACHPFEVLNLQRDGMDLWLMHNGVLDHSAFPGSKKASDTMQYVAKLRAMLQGNPKLIRNAAFREFLERDLGNPNKVVLLEGSGRWHYLNRRQGKEIGGVWYSNEYSLEKVYSGHGKGRAACRTAMAWDDDGDMGWRYYQSATVVRNDSGRLLDTAYSATIGKASDDDLTWALQITRVAGKEDQQTYWKKGYTGWLRMQRNPSTRGFYRHFLQDGEKQGADLCAVLPANSIQFRPKNETAWERGDAHTWTMEGGEHVPVPVTVIEGNNSTALATIIKQTTPAGFVTPLLDVADVARVADACGVRMNTLCRETNEPCIAGCTTQCTGDEAYVSQLFSDTNLRQMTEEEMLEAICDYPEEAALALGAAYNCRWAFDAEVA